MTEKNHLIQDGFDGLTKREHFASMAMQGILAMTQSVPNDYESKIANVSVRIADALIKALNEKP